MSQSPQSILSPAQFLQVYAINAMRVAAKILCDCGKKSVYDRLRAKAHNRRQYVYICRNNNIRAYCKPRSDAIVHDALYCDTCRAMIPCVIGTAAIHRRHTAAAKSIIFASALSHVTGKTRLILAVLRRIAAREAIYHTAFTHKMRCLLWKTSRLLPQNLIWRVLSQNPCIQMKPLFGKSPAIYRIFNWFSASFAV